MKINKILAIAINEYDSAELNNLHNCINDIKAIVKILSSKYHFDEIEILDKKDETTRSKIYNKLSVYFTDALENENILLIYAGHGEYNSLIKTGYWQPSDSKPNDPSSWINLSEIVNFIGASKAHHISLILDSCFSGAIQYENTRGGGVNAFDSKRSREVLSSGGIEKVSDGKQGQNSPFTEILVGILEKDTSVEFPFISLSCQLVEGFPKGKQQTPSFGSLAQVGHEGGSFVLKLKKQEEEPTEIKNINVFLKDKLKHLFIPMDTPAHLPMIEEIKQALKSKNNAVKEQKYDKAIIFRDKEKELIHILVKDMANRIKLKTCSSNNNLEEIKTIKSKIKEYKKNLTKRNSLIKKLEKNNLTLGISESTVHEISYMDLLELVNEKNPEIEYFKQIQGELFNSYYQQGNITDIYSFFLGKTSNFKSEFLTLKLNNFSDILESICEYEIRQVIGVSLSKDLDNLIQLRELDMRLLNWIKES